VGLDDGEGGTPIPGTAPSSTSSILLPELELEVEVEVGLWDLKW